MKYCIVYFGDSLLCGKSVSSCEYRCLPCSRFSYEDGFFYAFDDSNKNIGIITGESIRSILVIH